METPSKLSPSSVRKIILEEHEQLRGKLADVETSLQTKEAAALIKAVRELLSFFTKHIEHEEQILRPVLKEIDAWGSVRADRMNSEHEQQRQKICTIEKTITGGNFSEISVMIKEFSAELLIDMANEEAECLCPNLLKDDPITTSNYSG